MALATADVVGILGDNLRLRGSVLPIPNRRAVHWTRGLELRRGGATVLYTGQMYQLVPYIERLVAAEQQLADSPLARFTGLGRRVNRIVNVSAFMGRPSRTERERSEEAPRRVVALLRGAGVEPGCLFEDDLYSGTLAYDLGLDELVAAHARRVQAVLRRHGVRTAITIDPHTTHMLRTIYPTLLDGWDVDVRSYLEVLAGALAPADALTAAPFASPPPAPVSGSGAAAVALHDSCVYARHEGVVEEPRRLLAAAGVAVLEPEQAGKFTWCCGGPAEALFPERALATAQQRVAQLRAVSSECVTMCPLCLVNLSKAADGAVRFRDIAEVLLDARGDR